MDLWHIVATSSSPLCTISRASSHLPTAMRTKLVVESQLIACEHLRPLVVDICRQIIVCPFPASSALTSQLNTSVWSLLWLVIFPTPPAPPPLCLVPCSIQLRNNISSVKRSAAPTWPGSLCASALLSSVCCETWGCAEICSVVSSTGLAAQSCL